MAFKFNRSLYRSIESYLNFNLIITSININHLGNIITSRTCGEFLLTLVVPPPPVKPKINFNNLCPSYPNP